MKKQPKGYFPVAYMGVAASTKLALHYGMMGYLTICTIDIDNHYCELTVHHRADGLEDAPDGYHYTKRLCNIPHYSEYCEKDIYTTTFKFYWL